MSDQQRQFEQLLLSHVPLCFSVALRLTNNREHARSVTRDVLTRAWELSDQPDLHRSIKPRLLAMLRKRIEQRAQEPTALPMALAPACVTPMQLAAKR
ncbi:MAG: hypothetical protein SGI88_07110 [Candidatus Hydrogenedentes bacterium]|nr:hypothetical protein [Candidatus Hydrogenedentota bacterium]